MKKIYQNPTIKIVRIATQRLLADSLHYGRSTTTETSGNLSRRGGNDLWDDDEDDDY